MILTACFYKKNWDLLSEIIFSATGLVHVCTRIYDYGDGYIEQVDTDIRKWTQFRHTHALGYVVQIHMLVQTDCIVELGGCYSIPFYVSRSFSANPFDILIFNFYSLFNKPQGPYSAQ